VQLRMECKRKGIPLGMHITNCIMVSPTSFVSSGWWFKEYFDIKTEFLEFYPYFHFQSTKGPPLWIMLKGKYLLGCHKLCIHHSMYQLWVWNLWEGIIADWTTASLSCKLSRNWSKAVTLAIHSYTHVSTPHSPCLSFL